MSNEVAIFELFVCLGIFGVFYVHPWIRRVESTGLPLCYILSLAMIHWLGALIHLLPLEWRSRPDPYTLIGFEQAFFATVALAVGAFVIAPFILRILFDNKNTPVVRSRHANESLPYIYMGIGIVSFAILAPALRSVPSIYAASVAGVYLAVVGLCLACWSAYIQRRYMKLCAWMLAVCLIPILTIVTLGFVGYGSAAALLVLTFVITFYKPRWHAVIAFGLIGFLGLSLFVTYFRDRPQIRAKVWGGADYVDRISTVSASFGKFEFVDLQNPRHLNSIDSRLNQNYLVGRVVRTIESGQEQFAYGGTVYEGLLAMVPRIMWPDKPVAAGSGNTVSRYARMSFDQSTSVGIGHVMEFYINFGTLGVISGFLLMGTVIRILDIKAAFHLYRGNWQGFMSWFLPAISLLMVGGSFVDMFGSLAASIVLVIVVNRILTATQPSNMRLSGSPVTTRGLLVTHE